ncbi:DUF3368 domain-containing protein [Neolewinella antarctica]|uniref:DUF3368 domain-containing protein n=1 Tax=Neolewinella antarctica TaxID=442734 RepID=A0ABX0XAZ1_9BACT|nr:DUF3368 domain-containing protein [Neolewinella antarctica]NJC26438.1 hypothetical protein [Neolewinella antarctica]
MGIVVSDTTVITNLLQVGRLNLLRSLFGTVIIPNAVKTELDAMHLQELTTTSSDWLTVYSEKLLDIELVDASLDSGEREAIALSLEHNANLLVIDELKGRRVAEKLGIEIIGTIGILLLAKQRGKIERVAPVIREMISNGFWVSPALLKQVLISCNEAS